MSPDEWAVVVLGLLAEVARLRGPPFEPGVARGPLQFRSGYPEGKRPPRKTPGAQQHKAKKDDRRDRKRVDRRHSGGG